MGCKYQENCGGCCFRNLSKQNYQELKINKFKSILNAELHLEDDVFENPVFIDDGTRRRASFAFEYKKTGMVFGFNESKSNNIADCLYCPMLTPKINDNIEKIRGFLLKLCQIKTVKKIKGKKFSESFICKGDLLVLDAYNGIDIVLETKSDLELAHKMEIFDFVNSNPDIIRVSYRKDSFSEAEPVVEKLKPIIKIGGYDVFVAPGMFLQASYQGEKALVDTVSGYVADINGKIADLFCGIGTFSYQLANCGNKIVAVDVNKGLLDGFQVSVNKQMLHNIEIMERNLFKYPLEPSDLADFDAVVFDPPRAGAMAQVKELARAFGNGKIKKIIAVSCNPHSFVNDAKVLIEAGYKLKSITMVDQFVYSNHSELVALFTTN